MSFRITKPRNIVVALDSSSHSRFALSWALENVIRGGDHMILVSVGVFPGTWGDFLSNAFQGAVYNKERVEGLQQEAEEYALKSLMDAARIVQAHSEGTPGELKITHEVLAFTRGTTEPRQVILTTCDLRNADLLIVGSRGLGTLSRLLMGSVSEYCAHNAPCPVIVVREGKGGEDGELEMEKTGTADDEMKAIVEQMEREADVKEEEEKKRLEEMVKGQVEGEAAGGESTTGIENVASGVAKINIEDVGEVQRSGVIPLQSTVEASTSTENIAGAERHLSQEYVSEGAEEQIPVAELIAENRALRKEVTSLQEEVRALNIVIGKITMQMRLTELEP
ncbi:hypothetical protein HDU76_000410 [Blyttiomyces sp. JEL0837]|nr:hypothetical protein HDU76_000410 [Blyttiomyces sp. JEL0837]